MTPAPWRPKGRTETVAPMGHLYVRGDVAAGILVQDGSTVQVSASPERRWLDARGATATSDGLTTDGAAGLLPIDELDGAGWHLFPIDTFTLAIHAGQDEETASTTFVQLDAPLVTPGPHQLVFLDELRLELHGEEREVGPEGLRIELAELARHGALSVRIQPLD